MNTRRYPRTLAEAFGPYTDHRLHPMPTLRRPHPLVEFVRVFVQYRRTHSTLYAARLARDIAFRGLPF